MQASSQNLVLITDTSNSIYPFKELYSKAIDNIAKDYQTNFPEGIFSFITFNEGVTYRCLNKVARDVKTPLELVPEGLTSLYDCVCNILLKMCQFYSKIFVKNTVAVILTDGTDTTSKMVTAKHTALQIARCKEQGWKFIYLGTTPDAVNLGRALGCNVCILYSVSEKSFQEVSKAINDLVRFAQVPWKDADFDLRDLEDSMARMAV